MSKGLNIGYSRSINRDLLYYIAGPMTDIEENNYPAFDHAAALFRHAGLNVISPTEGDYVPENKENLTWQGYMKGGIGLLLKADGIILLQGWTQSLGARLELDIALDLKYPAYFYNEYVLTPMDRAS